MIFILWTWISFTSQSSWRNNQVRRKAHLYFSSPEHPSLTQYLQTTWLHSDLKSQDTVVESPARKILETLGFIDDKSNELEFVFGSGFLDCKLRENVY